MRAPLATLLATWLGAGTAVAQLDPILAGDPIDPQTGEAAYIPPGLPWIQAGPDGVFGSSDDVIDTGVTGDVDLVARVGHPPLGPAGEIPPPHGPVAAMSAAFGQGVPLPFSIYTSDGSGTGVGLVAEPDYLEGLPILVTAFADLDGDGYVGITHLDGDTGDAAIERAELEPVGRRYAISRHGVAEGLLSLDVGAPVPGVARVAVTAAALAGPFSDPQLQCASCHAWVGSEAWLVLPMDVDLRAVDPYPLGPPITTRLPFFPATDRATAFPPMPFERMAAHPDARVGARPTAAFEPDPSHPQLGESFTLVLDGSEPTIDVGFSFSGPATQFGLARSPGPSWAPSPDGRLRPGLDDALQVAPVEVLSALTIEAGSTAPVRVVTLDENGNVANPITLGDRILDGPPVATLVASGGLEIVQPDSDGDVLREDVVVNTPTGIEIQLRGVGSGTGRLVLEGSGSIAAVEVRFAGD